MIRRNLAAAMLTLAVVLAGPQMGAALAQNFSPYFETTGDGPLDIYNDAVLCTALLEGEFETLPDGVERWRIDNGSRDAREFALFMLDSGNVVDVTGANLGPDNLPIDLRNARSDWQVKLLSFEDEGETPDAEILRCLDLYEYDRE